MRKKKVHKSTQDRIIDIFVYVFFICFTFICIYPFYYLIINSISANDLSSSGQIMFLPKKVHFRNYIEILKLDGLKNAMIVSVSRTVLGTLLTVLTSGFLGFMFTQEKMFARNILYRFIILTMYVGAGIIPFYITMNNLHLTNTFWIYILPGIVAPFNIILVKTFVESIPRALQEAAEIDGANIRTVFLKVYLPLIKPILATIAIFCSVGHWNSFQDTLIMVTDEKLWTLQFILYKYLNESTSLAKIVQSSQGADLGALVANAATSQTGLSVKLTVTVIVVLPILFVYPCFQKYFVKGIMIGSIKG